jgi:thiol-disulfide isomerase/thioredoxin
VRWLILLAACTFAQAAAAEDFQRWMRGATPPLALADLKGRVHRLADYRGKVVLVNFWATWCAPCRDEMPSIERLRASLAAEPFEVLAVNLAEPLSRIEHFLAQMPLNFPILRDRDTQTAKAWHARMLPATYLVDGAGLIRYVRYGEFDWSSEPARAKVRELLRSIPRSAPNRAERSADGENSARLAASARRSAR